MKLTIEDLRKIIKESISEVSGMSPQTKLKGDPDQHVKNFLSSRKAKSLLGGKPSIAFEDIANLIDMDLVGGEQMMQHFIVDLSLDDTGSNTIEADYVDIDDETTWGMTNPSDVPPLAFFDELSLMSRQDVKRRARRGSYEFV